jgi:hypothetical protein
MAQHCVNRQLPGCLDGGVVVVVWESGYHVRLGAQSQVDGQRASFEDQSHVLGEVDIPTLLL